MFPLVSLPTPTNCSICTRVRLKPTSRTNVTALSQRLKLDAIQLSCVSKGNISPGLLSGRFLTTCCMFCPVGVLRESKTKRLFMCRRHLSLSTDLRAPFFCDSVYLVNKVRSSLSCSKRLTHRAIKTKSS